MLSKRAKPDSAIKLDPGNSKKKKIAQSVDFCYILIAMKSQKKEVFQINCPTCHSILWVDALTKEVIKSERGKKKKDTLDDLLLKEKKRVDAFERKFEATAELEKKKREKIEKNFEKALTEFEEDG
ncbi:MAG: hypothetical protein ACETWK_03930 [Candidatus Aminicenantaceae bacterium]